MVQFSIQCSVHITCQTYSFLGLGYLHKNRGDAKGSGQHALDTMCRTFDASMHWNFRYPICNTRYPTIECHGSVGDGGKVWPQNVCGRRGCRLKNPPAIIILFSFGFCNQYVCTWPIAVRLLHYSCLGPLFLPYPLCSVLFTRGPAFGAQFTWNYSRLIRKLTLKP